MKWDDPSDVVYDDRLKASISLYGKDRGTRERHRHGEVIERGVGRAAAKHAFDAGGCPLQVYYRRRLLSDSPFEHQRGEENERRHDAALRFLAAWERGGRRPRIVAHLDASVTISGRWHRDGGGDSWLAWSEAFLAMDRWASCVQSVVCFDELARDWAARKHRRMPRPHQVGMMALRLGLARLVDWYAAVDRSGRR